MNVAMYWAHQWPCACVKSERLCSIFRVCHHMKAFYFSTAKKKKKKNENNQTQTVRIVAENLLFASHFVSLFVSLWVHRARQEISFGRIGSGKKIKIKIGWQHIVGWFRTHELRFKLIQLFLIFLLFFRFVLNAFAFWNVLKRLALDDTQPESPKSCCTE